jgi:hypothetical protein
MQDYEDLIFALTKSVDYDDYFQNRINEKLLRRDTMKYKNA